MVRKARPDPQRQGPNRSMGDHVRGSGAQAAAGKGRPAGADSSKAPVSGVIGDAVQLAYDTIQQQIIQGQEAAERFSRGEYNNKNARKISGYWPNACSTSPKRQVSSRSIC